MIDHTGITKKMRLDKRGRGFWFEDLPFELLYDLIQDYCQMIIKRGNTIQMKYAEDSQGFIYSIIADEETGIETNFIHVFNSKERYDEFVQYSTICTRKNKIDNILN